MPRGVALTQLSGRYVPPKVKKVGYAERKYLYQNTSLYFNFFLFMSDAHHGINSSTQKYQSTQSNVALTSCRQDSGSPPF